eukprot:767669-Hanusia_phi.AAC.7
MSPPRPVRAGCGYPVALQRCNLRCQTELLLGRVLPAPLRHPAAPPAARPGEPAGGDQSRAADS